MMTVKDLKDKQRGPWIYTLLEGRALECCEHLSLDDLAAEDGERKLWQLLEGRFPEREALDLMGESLGEVFGLAAKDNESTKEWCARVKDCFDRCQRRANVSFPAQARGWITLHCAGLNDEQKAIIKAKTNGDLEYDKISAAFRSCFPSYRASNKARKAVGSLMVDEVQEETAPEIDSFRDVEAFLADHGMASAMDPDAELEPVSEGEAAEALAVTWKERRREIQKVSQNRRFTAGGSSAPSTRSFRVDVEELKKRTRCRKCGKIGHWARECRDNKPNTDKAAASDSTSAAGLAQFAGAAEWMCNASQSPEANGLVSSPGWGIVDSGCGRTLIGSKTLAVVQQMLEQQGLPTGEMYPSSNTFRFGNGHVETASKAIKLPVGLNGRCGTVDAAIIAGQAPLLLGRPTLEKLNVQMNFQDNTISFLDMPAQNMDTNSSGQIRINMMDFPTRNSDPSPVIAPAAEVAASSKQA